MLIDVPQRKESVIKSVFFLKIAITKLACVSHKHYEHSKGPQAFLHLFNYNPEFPKLILSQTLLWRITY